MSNLNVKLDVIKIVDIFNYLLDFIPAVICVVSLPSRPRRPRLKISEIEADFDTMFQGARSDSLAQHGLVLNKIATG